MSGLLAHVPRRRRQRAKRDGNHGRIVRALEDAGRSVQDLAAVGGGCPDILVGWGGRHLLLMEVKDPEGENKVYPSQIAWAQSWKGLPRVVVRSEAEALAATGVVVQRPVDGPRPRRAARPR